MVRGLQFLFLIVLCFQINAPFLSAHNERQNQTYDVARHVFHDGWRAIFIPMASFSLPGYEKNSFTVISQEVPFYGVFGWPLVKLFGHEPAMMRVIAAFFGLASIELMYLILQTWLAPGIAAIGAALWTLSPLVLQFGQVPMPDILCTAGMLAAFWFALKNKLPASSGCFLFAILAKVSVIVFGLPILTALLLARNCKSMKDFFQVAIFWGIVPLVGLLGWFALELYGPTTPWTIQKIVSDRSSLASLSTLKFYFFLLVCLLPYGLGLMGAAGCILAATRKRVSKMPTVLKWSLVLSNFFYLFGVVAKIPEPQYMLPLLAWLVLAAALGWEHFDNGSLSRHRFALATILGLQALTVIIFTWDLKTAHVPNFENIQSAGRLIPKNSRVIVAYPFYGASPAVWLNQNVFAVNSATELATDLPKLQQAGFGYLLIMDVKSHTQKNLQGGSTQMMAALFHAPTSAPETTLTDFATPASAFRTFCDGRFSPLYSSPHAVLYSLDSPQFQAH